MSLNSDRPIILRVSFRPTVTNYRSIRSVLANVAARYKYNLPRFLLLSFHFCFDFEGTIRKGKRMAGTSEAPPLPEGNSDDKLVKLAVAISLIRSKLTEKQPQPPQPQPPPPAEPEALRWKRKVVSSLCICSRK